LPLSLRGTRFQGPQSQCLFCDLIRASDQANELSAFAERSSFGLNHPRAGIADIIPNATTPPERNMIVQTAPRELLGPEIPSADGSRAARKRFKGRRRILTYGAGPEQR